MHLLYVSKKYRRLNAFLESESRIKLSLVNPTRINYLIMDLYYVS